MKLLPLALLLATLTLSACKEEVAQDIGATLISAFLSETGESPAQGEVPGVDEVAAVDLDGVDAAVGGTGADGHDGEGLGREPVDPLAGGDGLTGLRVVPEAGDALLRPDRGEHRLHQVRVRLRLVIRHGGPGEGGGAGVGAGVEKHSPGVVQAHLPHALERGQTLAQMAISWLLKDPRVTSVLIGARTVEQLEENLKAAYAGGFSKEELNELNA